MHLCHACSCPEILRVETALQADGSSKQAPLLVAAGSQGGGAGGAGLRVGAAGGKAPSQWIKRPWTASQDEALRKAVSAMMCPGVGAVAPHSQTALELGWC
eukprot:COSAG01_NODE_3658_length_5818_cov_3.227138_4_plen_101_part_00